MNTMFALAFLLYMGVTSRQSGGGLGAQYLPKWLSWLPEVLFAIPFGAALGYVLNAYVSFPVAIGFGILGAIVSYLGMQAATWTFLRWTKNPNPNLTRGGTLKPISDFIAKVFGYKLGDEGYSWIAAGVKGFIIGFPVGAVPLTVLWPLGYEIGSHARGRVEKYGLDPHAFAEFFAGVGAGIAILIFLGASAYLPV